MANNSELKDKKPSINDEEFPESLKHSIDKIINKEGYKRPSVVKKQLSTNGGSYLATLYEVDIKETEDGDKNTDLFIKQIIPGEVALLSVTEAYYKESFYYNELKTIFQELENEAKVPEDRRFKTVKSYSETNTEYIILENLAKKGFRTWHRMEVVTLKFAEMAMEQIARFHGVSFMMKLKHPVYFEDKIKPLKHHFVCNDEWRTYISHQCKVSVEQLSDDYKEKVKKFLPKIFEKYPKYLLDPSVPGATLCHGDWRPSNILIKEINGDIAELAGVDFQLIYYGCPINDIFYFIFLSTNQEFRKKHLFHLKDYYFDSLEKYLNFFGVDVNQVYPRSDLESQFKQRLDYGLIVALYLLPFSFTSENNVPDISEDDFLNLDFTMDDRGFERVREVIDEYSELGIL